MYFILAILITTLLYIGFYFCVDGKNDEDFRNAKILFSLSLIFYIAFIITAIVQK